MTVFWKSAGVVLICVILGISIGKTEKGLSLLLSIAASCIVAGIAVTYLQPVFDFLWKLSDMTEGQGEFVRVLLKVSGVAVVSELVGLICSEAGNNAVGKTFQIMSSAVILYLSVPIFQSLLTIIQNILGEI